MKFNEYLDVIYVNKNLKLQQEFSLKDQAVTRAIPDLINRVRQFYVWVAYFQLIWGYWKSRLTDSWPISLRNEMIKKAREQAELDLGSKNNTLQDQIVHPA